jgi:hypothetical protein
MIDGKKILEFLVLYFYWSRDAVIASLFVLYPAYQTMHCRYALCSYFTIACVNQLIIP